MKKFANIVLITIVSTVGFPGYSLAGLVPPELTNQELNTLVALEATQNVLILGALHVNQTIQAVQEQTFGTWSGTIDDDSWNLQFDGSINDIFLTANQTGVLDLSAGLATWDTTGVLGTETFLGNGTIEFDPTWQQVVFGIGVAGVQVISASTIVGGLLGVSVSGLLVAGVVAADDIAEEIESEILRPPPPNPITPVSSQASLSSTTTTPAPLMDGIFSQSGNLNTSNNTISFTSQFAAVPAPTTFALLGTGFVWFRIRRARGTVKRLRLISSP